MGERVEGFLANSLVYIIELNQSSSPSSKDNFGPGQQQYVALTSVI